MEFKFMEITMHLMRVVNGGCLVEPFDWLALYHRKVYCWLKILLDQEVHPSEFFHSTIVLYTYQT